MCNNQKNKKRAIENINGSVNVGIGIVIILKNPAKYLRICNSVLLILESCNYLKRLKWFI